MKEIQTLLTNLRTKPVFALSAYAMDLEARLIKALDGDYDIPISGSVSSLQVTNGVAEIEINGFIAKRVGLPQEWLDVLGIVDLDLIDAQLNQAKNDPAISSVLLSVTSPGGYALGNRTTANIVRNMGKEVVVWSDMQNASAAYLISSQASSIVINPECEIGCVGTMLTYFNYARQLDQQGIDVKVFKSGTYKGLLNPYEKPTTDQEAIVQAQTDEMGAEFRSIVNSTRSIDNQYLQGLTYRGATAVKFGFADGLADSKAEVLSALSKN